MPKKPTALPAPMPSVDARMALAQELVQREMPTESEGASITPMGWLGRFLSRGAEATTNPLTGNIRYNAPALEGHSQEQLADLLTHELTHRGQIQNMSYLDRAMTIPEGVGRGLQDSFGVGGATPYHQRPEEMDAYIAETKRALAQGRGISTPDSDGVQRYKADIHLPSPPKKRQ